MTNKEQFRRNIRMFEIEPHSYCNRKCWFCPNSFIDRQFRPVKFLDQKIYLQILQDLASINYSEVLCFAAFCEPFSQPSFLDRIKEADALLPNALLQTNTNTDYLTIETVQDAAKAGLNIIKAQLYFDKDEEYTDKATQEKFTWLQKKLPGIEFKKRVKNQWFALVGKDLVVHAYSKDFRKVGHNRCDVQVRKTTKRYHTCGEPIQMFGVNYNGWAVPCCNIRSDYPPHKNVLLGRMNDTPGRIFDLYQGTLIPETQYPCSVCMGKQWHPNTKIVYTEIIRELKNGE